MEDSTAFEELYARWQKSYSNAQGVIMRYNIGLSVNY